MRRAPSSTTARSFRMRRCPIAPGPFWPRSAARKLPPTTVSLPRCGTVPDGLEAPTRVTDRTLSYSRKAGRYTVAFASSEAWAGTCRQLVVRLADGTDHRANYRFTR